jgi:hypothetical protein
VSATVNLEPWGSDDLRLLDRLMGDPRMTEHLGGPESPNTPRERQGHYERLARGVRVRVPEGALHDPQRLAPGPARLATCHVSDTGSPAR